MPDAPPRPVLRPVELRVLRKLAAGRTVRETAGELHYSYSYTRRVVAAASSALGARTQAQALYRAARSGLL